MFEQITTFAYNEFGDKVTERTNYAQGADTPLRSGVSYSMDEKGNLLPSEPAGEVLPKRELPANTEFLYVYDYDDHGNWFRQKRTGDFGNSFSITRGITYY